MLQPLQGFTAHGGNLALGHDVKSHHISQAAAFHELHHNPKFTTTEIALDEVDNVGVRAVLHHNNFVDDQVFLGLLLEIHLLDGNEPVGASFVSSKDATRSSLANLGEAPEDFSRVTVVTYLLQRGHDIEAITLSLTLTRSSLCGSSRARLLSCLRCLPWVFCIRGSL